MKNLDTGETTNLKEAETDLPKCVDPLVLHIMERTQDYPRYLYTKIYKVSMNLVAATYFCASMCWL